MNPRIATVSPNSQNYTVTIRFTNRELLQFDVNPYLTKGFFRELQDRAYFNAVRVALGSIKWPHGQDFCPDTLYELSEPVTEYGVGTMIDSL
ncbi:MAG: DUF2442 domain-containing protein [Chloroflexi bacterium]|nr:MAG: DUF2442 domain-containing protein [Chloroflexota bacterium]